MSNVAVEINFGSDVIPLISRKKQEIPQRLKEIVVIELFREAKISTGKAAQILSIKRSDFISLLSRHDVPYFSQDKEELIKDFSCA